uniref:G-protein coupled receptors family 1 profile domain-containing protein n=1 Tax=Xiphophorus maculatus TaxID=8083 RepID=M3ZF56_XIPMA
VGFSLNSFTLWFHCCGAHGQVSKSWMIYLKHLTAADFLLCVNIPLRIIHYARSSFTIHLLYCSIGSPLLYLNIAASILFMGYIAANFAFIIFLLVLFSLVFFYYSTSRRVLQVQQAQLASPNSKILMKSRRNMLVLVSVFCFCFVPYHIVRIPCIILWGKCSVELYYVKEFAVLLSVSNICLDPLIYVFLCKEFRAQL